MMSRTKITIWCAALLLILISTVAPIQVSAESWKQIIVKCSPQDLDKIRNQFGAAIVDAIPGHYLLTVFSSTDIRKIEAIQDNGSIQADDNSRIAIQRVAPRTA